MGAVVQFGVFLASLITYITTEKTYLHVSSALRKVLWSLVAVSFVQWVLACLHAMESISSWLVLFAIAMAASIEDSYQQRNLLTPISVHHKTVKPGSPEAVGKAELVTDLVRSINKWSGETLGLRHIFAKAAQQMRRRQLYAALKSTSPEDLNYILSTVSCALVFDCAETRLLWLLTKPDQRLLDLSMYARAAIVDGLQKLGLRFQAERQQAVANVILNTHGPHLSRLKSYLDDGGDYHTTYKLIYDDMQGELQKKVMEHVIAEGQKLRSNFREALPNGPPGIMLKIISDIDDTLMCSGGKYPAGCDTRYPRKCIYPGVLAFYNELDRGHVERCKQAVEDVKTCSGPSAGVSFRRPAPTSFSDPSPQEATPTPTPALRDALAAVSLAAEVSSSGPSATCLPGPEDASQPIAAHSGALEGDQSSITPAVEAVQAVRAVAAAMPTVHAAEGSGVEVVAAAVSGAGASPGGSETGAQRAGVSDDFSGCTGGHSGLGAIDETDNLHVVEELRDTLLKNVSSVPSIPLLQGGLLKTAAGRSSTGSSSRDGRRVSFHATTSDRETDSSGFSRGASSTSDAGDVRNLLRRTSLARISQLLGHRWEGWNEAGSQSGVNLVFLSARPQSYKGFTEADSFRRIFHPLIRPDGLQCMPLLLLGDLASGPMAMARYMQKALKKRRTGLRRSIGLSKPTEPEFPQSVPVYYGTYNSELYHQLAQRKMNRFRGYAALYPECYFMFIGDNGQGDVLCAEWIAQEYSVDHQVRLSFIQLVQPLHHTLSEMNEGDVDDGQLAEYWEQEGIQTFFTYIGAAVKAYHAGVISLEGVHRVAVASCNDVRRLYCRYAPQYPWRKWQHVVKQHNQDLEVANRLLPPELQLTLLELPDDR